MILSTGKPSDLKTIEDKLLQSEERTFFSRYKTAYKNTMNSRGEKQAQAFEAEIVAFNKWRDLFDERSRREENKRR